MEIAPLNNRAPMVAYADGALAAAVSEAGGLGTFGAWSVLNVDELPVVREETRDEIVTMITKRDIINFYYARGGL